MYLEISVKTGSDCFRIEKKEEKALVFVKSAPIKGAANAEIVKSLNRILKTEVRIVKGAKSKTKTLHIPNLAVTDFWKRVDIDS